MQISNATEIRFVLLYECWVNDKVPRSGAISYFWNQHPMRPRHLRNTSLAIGVGDCQAAD